MFCSYNDNLEVGLDINGDRSANYIQHYKRIVPTHKSETECSFEFLDQYCHIDCLYLDIILPPTFVTFVVDRTNISSYLLRFIQTVIPERCTTIHESDSSAYAITGNFIDSYCRAYKLYPKEKLCYPVPLIHLTNFEVNWFVFEKSAVRVKTHPVNYFFAAILQHIPETYFEFLPIELICMIVDYVGYSIDIELVYRSTIFYDTVSKPLVPISVTYDRVITYKIEGGRKTDFVLDIYDQEYQFNFNRVIIDCSSAIDEIEIRLGAFTMLREVKNYSTIYHVDRDIAEIYGLPFQATPDCYLLDITQAMNYIKAHATYMSYQNGLSNVQESFKKELEHRSNSNFQHDSHNEKPREPPFALELLIKMVNPKSGYFNVHLFKI